ncbi:MAG: MoxR family ATPase [Spirochaetia bacterium]|jgi:MoxR-like ATPase|nr:MoxR family ATPase [Spirochaetia bacterium]
MEESISKVLQEKQAVEISGKIEALINNIKSVIYVEKLRLEYIIASKIAGGHVILADTHGVGKTSLARALAGSIDNSHHKTVDTGNSTIQVDPFSRIQCTVDLLPQDIIGYTRLDGKDGNFMFSKGPIFANFVLCDEINLLTPKTQGSFFQAMEEQKVTVEGKTYNLPSPFFIIATMNLEGAHLFPLPAPQLDRFMIQISMGIPGFDDEKNIVNQHSRSDGWISLKQVIKADELIEWQEMVDRVSIHPELVDYIVKAIRGTRENPYLLQGASPRAGVKLSRLARSLALVRGLNFVTPDIIKELFVPAISHRVTVRESAGVPAGILADIIESIKIAR